MKRKLALTLVIGILLFSTLACQLVIPSTAIPTFAPTTPAQATLPADDSAGQVSLVQEEQVLISLYQNVSPGVVLLTVTTKESGGLGSGFVYDTDGHIITNKHVVDGATLIEVDFPSGFKAYGSVVGVDVDSDLAVVKVDAPASELHPLKLGDSSHLQVGQTVVAIGNPFGLNSTMTMGIISALGRSFTSDRATSGGGRFSTGGVIQTDTAINPGNSGGPLLNLSGEVIGINRSIITNNTTSSGEPTNSGIGFAVPINIIKRVAPAIIKNGSYDYPYLGITSLGVDLNLELIDALGLKSNTGVYVTTVAPGGPADKAGIQGASTDTSIQGLQSGGDLIIAMDDTPIRTYDDLITFLVTEKSPGDTVVVTVLRGEENVDLTVTLDKRP